MLYVILIYISLFFNKNTTLSNKKRVNNFPGKFPGNLLFTDITFLYSVKAFKPRKFTYVECVTHEKTIKITITVSCVF